MNNDTSTYNHSITFCAICQYKNGEINNIIGMFNNIKINTNISSEILQLRLLDSSQLRKK